MKVDHAGQRRTLAEALQAEEDCHELLTAWPEAVLYLDTPQKGSTEKTRGPRSERTPEALRIAEALCQSSEARKMHQDALTLWRRAESLRWSLLPDVDRLIWRQATTIAQLPQVRSEAEDLVQEGRLGFLRACRRFDPQAGTKLLTYAKWWIRAAMTRHVDTAGRVIRQPSGMTEEIRLIDKASRELVRCGLPVNAATLSEVTKFLPERVQALLEFRQPLSLDGAIAEGEDRSLLDMFAGLDADDLDREVDTALQAGRLKELIDGLDERSAAIVEFRAGLVDGVDHSLDEAGELYGISRERARQIERAAHERLREQLSQPRTQNPHHSPEIVMDPNARCPIHPDRQATNVGICRDCERAVSKAARRYKTLGRVPQPGCIAARAILAVDLGGKRRVWFEEAKTLKELLQAQTTVRPELPGPSQPSPAPTHQDLPGNDCDDTDADGDASVEEAESVDAVAALCGPMTTAEESIGISLENILPPGTTEEPSLSLAVDEGGDNDCDDADADGDGYTELQPLPRVRLTIQIEAAAAELAALQTAVQQKAAQLERLQDDLRRETLRQIVSIIPGAVAAQEVLATMLPADLPEAERERLLAAFDASRWDETLEALRDEVQASAQRGAA